MPTRILALATAVALAFVAAAVLYSASIYSGNARAFGLPPNPAAAAPVGAIIHGDIDCSGGVNSVDSLKILRYVALLPNTPVNGCPNIGAVTSFAVHEPGHNQGDVDCSDGVNSVDALKILRYVALLPNTPVNGCPNIGDTPGPTPTPTPSKTATPTPSGTPTPTPSKTATPVPSPLSAIGRCWIAVIAYDLAEPGILSGSESCYPPVGSPSYSCYFSTYSSYVDCDTSSVNYPDYSCYFYSFLHEADCDTFSSGWPDYDCGGYEYLNSVDCHTFSLDWPDYGCYVYSYIESVSCTSWDMDFPSFTCDRDQLGFDCY